MISNQPISFYQLGSQYQELFSRLYDHETGEVDQEVEAQLNALSPTTEKKCIAVTSWIKKMQADYKELEALEEEIKIRKFAYTKEITKAMDYLESNMKRCGIKEVKCPYFTVRIKNNPFSTEITNEALLPERFMRTKEIVRTETKPDKNAIKEEVLKTGVQVPGAIVQQKTKLEILTDKI